MLHALLRSTVLLASFLLPASLGAVDFLRGDANSDRVVSLADAHAVLSYEFRGGAAPECFDAANANSDGKVNVADPIWIVNYLFRNGPTMLSPFPEPGPAPADLPTAGSCEAYGNGSPLEDPGAELKLLDAVAPGGADGLVTVTLAYSSSRALGGYSGELLVAGSVVTGSAAPPRDLSGTLAEDGFQIVNDRDGRVTIGFLPALESDVRLPPGQDRPALELPLCLLQGTKAGTYALGLQAGELVDAATSRSIRPLLSSGLITVLQDLAPGIGCERFDPTPCEPVEPAGEVPDVGATFRLEGATGRVGQSVRLPFFVQADRPIGGLTFSIDYDEEVLLGIGIGDPLPPARFGTSFVCFNLGGSALNEVPGSGGLDEGYFAGSILFGLDADCVPVTLPVSAETKLLELELVILPSLLHSTEVQFADGGRLGRSGEPIRNSVKIDGHEVAAAGTGAIVFENCLVSVLPDITIFLRGDSNGDARVDLSDAQRTLGYLFLGTARPACHDAADANDDGEIDIGDPIATLSFLFLGTESLPTPYPEAGEDPTPDGLGCLSRE